MIRERTGKIARLPAPIREQLNANLTANTPRADQRAQRQWNNLRRSIISQPQVI